MQHSGLNYVLRKIHGEYQKLIGKLEKVDPFYDDKLDTLRQQGEVGAYFLAIQPGSPVYNPNWDSSISEWLERERKRLAGDWDNEHGVLTPLNERELSFQQGYIKGIRTIKNRTEEETLKQNEYDLLKLSHEKLKQTWEGTEEKEKKIFATKKEDWLPDKRRELDIQKKLDEPFGYYDAENAEEYGYSSIEDSNDDDSKQY